MNIILVVKRRVLTPYTRRCRQGEREGEDEEEVDFRRLYHRLHAFVPEIITLLYYYRIFFSSKKNVQDLSLTQH